MSLPGWENVHHALAAFVLLACCPKKKRNGGAGAPSAYQHADECPFGQCIVATPYVQLAARNCSVGVLTTTDYRGKQPRPVGAFGGGLTFGPSSLHAQVSKVKLE